ncbi:hypothetical protein [Bradyrhizobium symbiodeficiens]|uniref:hypothetical protein n=1 Tax=Bradyrhizobium symbiodeficiens TaxID=1404367 RepID=UPI00140FB8F0|nr:hypothetical protein [Bradyrhizobium symbiodeficiens]QIO98855.1 hypothetical protein HAU86_03115 [Bradyrhizobium symbiodeficiens]
MAKEFKSAQELSDLIHQVVGIPGFDVVVRRDHACRWQPIILSAPANPISFHRHVEEIADRMRTTYDLAT